MLTAFIAVVLSGDECFLETTEGIHAYEILFLSSFRFCRVNTICPFGSSSAMGIRRTLGRHCSIHVAIEGSFFPNVGHP